MEGGGFIFKNTNGFTLIEVVGALSIITVIAAVLVPVYTLVQTERQVIAQERAALSILEEEMYFIDEAASTFDHEKTRWLGDNEFFIETKEGKDWNEICISWLNVKQRPGEHCAYFK
ncbi:type II secretion system protein [Thalassobacillus sp. C254]|uniref:type II secretion system protein n=1 Tax=Thalassobacillus sp. C254 TaxID=1225341 RepID=UPI0006CF617B|nr:type II secretion system protein [Thalassobacillus sp. C254]